MRGSCWLDPILPMFILRVFSPHKIYQNINVSLMLVHLFLLKLFLLHDLNMLYNELVSHHKCLWSNFTPYLICPDQHSPLENIYRWNQSKLSNTSKFQISNLKKTLQDVNWSQHILTTIIMTVQTSLSKNCSFSFHGCISPHTKGTLDWSSNEQVFWWQS